MGELFVIVKSFKINKKLTLVILVLLIIIILISYYFFISKSVTSAPELFWNNFSSSNYNESTNNFIKWVDFNISSDVLSKTAKLDIDSHNSESEIKYNWIELVSYLACKTGGNLKKLNQNELNK